jgi:hypothetical protein
MKSRLKVSGLHFSASACVLLLVLGVIYFGWYRWPGWYLTGVLHVLPIIVAVDLVLGPLLTLVIANPRKSSRELARDIACIAVVQLVALSYGAITLWKGRPLYYTYSAGELSVTQCSELQPEQITLARQSNPEFAPHWYSLPSWVWAALPKDPKANNAILFSALRGGPDVTAMPAYFKPWPQGLQELRARLQKVSDLHRYFSGPQRDALAKRMQAYGLDPDSPDTLPMVARGASIPLLAVFDPKTLRIKALLQPG